jgi:hypothetical protein
MTILCIYAFYAILWQFYPLTNAVFKSHWDTQWSLFALNDCQPRSSGQRTIVNENEDRDDDYDIVED